MADLQPHISLGDNAIRRIGDGRGADWTRGIVGRGKAGAGWLHGGCERFGHALLRRAVTGRERLRAEGGIEEIEHRD